MRKIYLLFGILLLIALPIILFGESYPGANGVIKSKKKGVFPFGYASVYPPAQNGTYVKATSHLTTPPDYYQPWFATDPALSLIGSGNGTCWVAKTTATTNQWFQIDLGAGNATVITRIYYENSHATGGNVSGGAKNILVYGTNTDASFGDTTYATTTGWDLIATDTTVTAIHVLANTPDPKYLYLTNSTAYRYYGLRIANNWGGTTMGIRRIELQVAR
jgi:hypothetical protein